MVRILAALLYAALISTSLAIPDHGDHSSSELGEGNHRRAEDSPYDYIIVGSGLTGLVVANRLSENPDDSNPKSRHHVQGPNWTRYPLHQRPRWRKRNRTVLDASSIDAKTQTRSSSLTAYYDPASSRSNLKMLTRHQVLHLTFTEDGTTVSGVVAVQRTTGEEFAFHANKEVILAAGAIHTPQILQVSGIGPKSIVEAAGIRSRVDLPGVGSNFQDHPVAYLNWTIENTFPPADILTKNATFAVEALEEYHMHLSGPYTKAQSTSIAFLSLSMITDNVDSLISIAKEEVAKSQLPEGDPVAAGFEAQRKIILDQLKHGSVAALEFPFNGLGAMPIAIEKPLSRGTVHINSSDPRAEPVVTFNALQNPLDRAELFAFIQFTRKFFKTKALASMNSKEVTPGADMTTQEEVITALNAKYALAPSFAHPSCSCPMMPEEKGGCVSPDLLVYGTKNLSIIDSSIIPIIPSAQLQASLYAVAEKAADIIKRRS